MTELDDTMELVDVVDGREKNGRKSDQNAFLRTALLIIVTLILIPSGGFLVHFAWRANSVYAEMNEVKVEIAEAIAAHSHKNAIDEVKEEIDEVKDEIDENEERFDKILDFMTKLDKTTAGQKKDIEFIRVRFDDHVDDYKAAQQSLAGRLDKIEEKLP